MEGLSTEVVAALKELLPGFVAAWVFFSCTAHQKPSPFERVIQALIFMAFIIPIAALIREFFYLVGRIGTFGQWTADVNLGWSVLVALALGLSFSVCSNKDWCHKKLRDLGLTKRTSHPSEWFSAFNSEERYVTLHLKDRRRVHGFPKQWPDYPSSGHFLLLGAEWLGETDRVTLTATHTLMIPAKSVAFVEVMFEPSEMAPNPTTVIQEVSNGEQSGSVPEGDEGVQRRLGVKPTAGAIDGAACVTAASAPAVEPPKEIID